MSKRRFSVLGVMVMLGFPWCSSVYAAPATPPAQSAPLPPGETVAPAGTYQAAWLTLENGLPAGEDGGSTALPMFLGLRDGKCVQAWSVTNKTRFNWFDRIELKLDGASLKGELEGRAPGTPSVLQGDFMYAIDARVEGDKVSGFFTGTFGGTALSGKLSGTLRGEAEVAKDNVALDWTSYLGNEGTAAAPPSNWKLVDSFEEARPVWKSEQTTPAGWGACPDMRYWDAAMFEGLGGGSSTPLVWGGKVYLYYYYPSPKGSSQETVVIVPPAAGGTRKKGEPAPPPTPVEPLFAKLTKHPVELKALHDFFRLEADDFVLCLDSATGKTLWRAMFPRRQRNLQTHKYRAANPTPWIEGGRIYVQNYAAGVYCLDAQTGKLIWEHPGNQGEFSTSSDSPNMTMAEGVVVVGLRGVLKGLDAATGKLLWGTPWGFNAPVKWTSGERSFVISSGKCLDPKTGKVVWTAPVEELGYPRVCGNLLLGVGKSEDISKRKDQAAPAGQDADTYLKGLTWPLEAKLHCIEMKPEGAKLKWSAPVNPVGTGEATMAIANGHVYFGGQILDCIRLDTGEVMARQPKAPCHLNPTMCYSDGRVILFPENHHGKMQLHMVDADPRTLNVLTEAWRVPHPTTTAYANMGIGVLLVDGRLISRGQDGIYCYDLRKGAAK